MISSMQVAGGRYERFVRNCGWVALSVYIFSWFSSLDVSRAAEVVFLLCFIFLWFREPDRKIKYHWVFLVFLAFIALEVFVYFFAIERFPGFADGQVKGARHIAKLFLCITVAWWLRGSVKAAVYLVAIFVAGFLFALLIGFDASQWIMGLQGHRVDFGFTNAQHTAVYFAMALIFSVCWCWCCYQKSTSIVLLLVPGGLVILSMLGVIITQTRAVWLGCFITLLLVAIVAIFLNKKKAITLLSTPKVGLFFVLGAMLSIVFLWQFSPLIEKRLEYENQVIEDLVEGNLQNISYGSIGNRINTWRYAIKKIQERPLTGWGGESRKPLIDEGPFPDWVKRVYGHFHNGYIDITLAYGLLGFSLLAILTWVSLKGVFSLWRHGEPVLFFGLLSAWGLFFVVNLFESYIIFKTGLYIYLVLGGIGLSFYLFGVKRHE